MKRRTLNRRIAQATGLVGVGILALTGCEGTAEEQQDIQEDGQEGADPDGAEGEHGPEPDEIAEDDDDEEGDDDEEDGLGAGEAPDLAEVEERIWESALEQDSVEIRVTHEEAPEELEEAIGQQPPGDQDDQDQEDQDQETEDPDSGAEHAIELIYTGDLAGEGSSASYRLEPLGLEGTFLSFGEELFQDREGFVGDYALERPEESDTPEPEDLDQAMERGWIDHSEMEPMLNVTAGQYVEETRGDLDSVLGVEELSELGAEGEPGTHEGEDVWVYESEEVELIILADEEDPLPLLFDIRIEGAEFQVEFLDWNASEEPERPDEQDVYSLEEIQDLVTSL